jgi:hypothetical protein
MRFYQKCQYLATQMILTTDPDNFDYPDSLSKNVKTLISNIKPKLDILDKINIPYIENVFDTKPEVLKKTLQESCNCDIPDGLINTLAKGLYSKDFNTMDISEQAIIKVLSVYLMIQI